MIELLPNQQSLRHVLHVDALRIYTTVTGEIIVAMGNTKVLMQPQDVLQHVNEMLARADRLAKAYSNGNVQL